MERVRKAMQMVIKEVKTESGKINLTEVKRPRVEVKKDKKESK